VPQSEEKGDSSQRGKEAAREKGTPLYICKGGGRKEKKKLANVGAQNLGKKNRLRTFRKKEKGTAGKKKTHVRGAGGEKKMATGSRGRPDATLAGERREENAARTGYQRREKKPDPFQYKKGKYDCGEVTPKKKKTSCLCLLEEKRCQNEKRHRHSATERRRRWQGEGGEKSRFIKGGNEKGCASKTREKSK